MRVTICSIAELLCSSFFTSLSLFSMVISYILFKFASYHIWATLEVRTFASREKIDVATRDGMASLCERSYR